MSEEAKDTLKQNEDTQPVQEEAPRAEAKKPRPRRAKKISAKKVILIVLGIIVALIAAVLIGINAYVRVSCSNFYAAAKPAFEMPGLDEGFIPQDLDYVEATEEWLFSGYVDDDGASPIYRRAKDGSISKVYINYPNGNVYRGHGSGITSNSQFVFVTDKQGYLVYDLDKITNAEDGDYILARAIVDVDFAPAFMNIQNGVLYVGNFYREGNYETPIAHRKTTPDGSENPAVVYAYEPSEYGLYGFESRASFVFSIPERIQGIAVTPDNKIVLSQSYGPDLSHLLIYRMSAIKKADQTFLADERQVPLYYLDSNGLINDVTLPPMSEGIEYHAGDIYIAEESASSKYLFGKLYGAGQVYAFPATSL